MREYSTALQVDVPTSGNLTDDVVTNGTEHPDAPAFSRRDGDTWVDVTAGEFLDAFDFREEVERVRIDVSHAHIWDLTGVGAIDRAVLKFRKEGVEAEVIGMNEASATIMDKLAVHNDERALERAFGH